MLLQAGTPALQKRLYAGLSDKCLRARIFHVEGWIMFNRRYRVSICFQGPEGTGKTTLIRNLLRSTRTQNWLVCRIQPASSPEEEGKWTTTEETKLIEREGAHHSKAYYKPADLKVVDNNFWDSDFMQKASDAIAFEGKTPWGIEGDLYVHVMRPLEDGEELVSYGDVEACKINAREYLEMFGINLPEDLHVLSEEERELIDQEIEESQIEEEIIEEESFEIPDHIGEALICAAKGEPMPLKQKAWKLNPKHENLERCGLIVVNIHNESERPAAERTIEKMKELKSNPELRKAILGHRYELLRRTFLIANLHDPKDPQLKKALARIKRVVRENVEEVEDSFFL